MATLENVNRYLEPGSRSSRLYERASKVMPGGNTRTTIFVPPYPFYAKRGYGCTVVDEDGQERIDFINNLTSLILGHANPQVVEAVVAQVQRGTCFSWPTESEIRLAEMITSRVKSVEKIRFANSGTEAVMYAVKAARAYTGRPKIAKFEGCYHGGYDYVEVSLDPTEEAGGDPKAPTSVLYSPGSSPRILEDVVVLPFNDIDAVESILKRERDTVAGVIVDPMPSRAGLIPARPGFMAALREITRRYGMVLISDEVITFRLSDGGAQPVFGYDSDLTTFGKLIGGGFPVGGVGGSSEVMSMFDPSKGKPKLPHYGTFNANPATMVAGVAVLELLTPRVLEHINALGDAARSRLNAAFQRVGFDAQTTGAGSLFRIILTAKPLVDYRSTLLPLERRALYQDLAIGLSARGIAMTVGSVSSISVPMTMKEIDRLVEAVEDWVREKQGPRHTAVK